MTFIFLTQLYHFTAIEKMADGDIILSAGYLLFVLHKFTILKE